MASNNPIVTGLPAYIEEHRTELIAKAVLDSKSVSYFNLMTGVNSPTALNLISTDISLQDGSDCGFSATTSTELTQRVIEPKVLKVNTTFCPKRLLGKWAASQVRIASGKENLPFEQDFVDGIVSQVQTKIEKMVWRGASGSTTECVGLVPILSAATGTIKVEEASGTTALQAITDTYMALPAEIIEKDDTVIFVPEDIYRAYIQALVAANRYHYDPQYGEGVYKIEGSNVRVIAVNGLNTPASAATYIVAGRLSNIYFGTDMENDSETFDLWFSRDDQIFKFAMNFAVGVQVAFPDQMVLTTIAANA